MRAGLLNRQLVLQAPGAGQDDVGQPLTTWVEVARPWANIRHSSGVESIKAGADTSMVKASVRIRYRNDVTVGMRFLLGTTAYNILAKMPDEGGREFTDLACEVIS